MYCKVQKSFNAEQKGIEQAPVYLQQKTQRQGNSSDKRHNKSISIMKHVHQILR